MSLASRKRAELQHKVDSITTEFEQWRTVSAPEAPLEKHYTQVLRVTRTLEAFAAGVSGEIGDDDAATVARAPEVEFEILEVHRLWEFFRGKLAQRYVSWLQPHLAAADDLASACYAAAQEALPEERAAELKEPPLVFFSGSSSPLATARGELFEGELVPGEPLSRAGSALARRLPISVIEIPWYQLAHLPDAPAICHEVGHTVEDDLQLTDRLRTLLSSALEGRGDSDKRQSTWEGWLGEVFADVYGTLGAGPAFVSTLMDFIAPEAVIGANGSSTPDEYPPAGLRIELSLVALERLGHGEASDLRTRWADDIRGAGDHREDDQLAKDQFAKDAPAIVERLLYGPYPELGCRSLVDILPFTEADQRQSSSAADDLLDGKVPVTKNVRHLHAGARLAFDTSPGGYDRRAVGRLVVDRIGEVRSSGPRGRAEAAPDVADLEAQDEAIGRDLLSAVRSSRRASIG